VPTVFPYYHCTTRDGHRGIARQLGEGEQLEPWKLIGHVLHGDQFFSLGDPEMWRVTGHWREDGTPSPMDIIHAGEFVQPGSYPVKP